MDLERWDSPVNIDSPSVDRNTFEIELDRATEDSGGLLIEVVFMMI